MLNGFDVTLASSPSGAGVIVQKTGSVIRGPSSPITASNVTGVSTGSGSGSGSATAICVSAALSSLAFEADRNTPPVSSARH